MTGLQWVNNTEARVARNGWNKTWKSSTFQNKEKSKSGMQLIISTKWIVQNTRQNDSAIKCQYHIEWWLSEQLRHK